MNAQSRRLALFGLLAAAMLLVPACGSTRTTRENFELDAVPLAIDILSFAGSVRVEVDPGRPDAEVKSTIWVSEEAPKQEVAAIMEGVVVGVGIGDEDGRAVLRIRAASGHEEYEHRVDLVVRVPRCDGIRVNTRGGHVVAIDTDGATTLVNRDGGIDFRTSHVVDEPLTLTTVDGDIFCQIPFESSGAIDMLTLDGSASYKDFADDTAEVYIAPRTFTGTLNEGTNPIVCRTNDGDVWLRVREDPVAYVPPLGLWRPSNPEQRFMLAGSYRWTQNLPDDDLPEPLPRPYE